MKRRLLNLLAAVSLVLFVAAGMLWVRSYWVFDRLSNCSSPRILVANSLRGRLVFGVYRLSDASERLPPGGWHPLPLKPGLSIPTLDWRYLGFAVVNERTAADQQVAVAVPHWFALGLSGILPFRWFTVWRRRRLRERRGLCLTCGYDLRASIDRCPECGTANPAPGQGVPN